MSQSDFDINRVIADALEVIQHPKAFYRRMPRDGGYVEPVIFLVVMAFASGVILTVFSLLGSGRVGVMAVGLWVVVIFPMVALIGSFVAAAIMFVIWKLMGTSEPFGAAYRCVAYASAIYPATAVLGLVPYAGSVAGIAWGMVLMAIASVEVHRIEARRAYPVIAVLAVVVAAWNINNEMYARRSQQELERRLEQMGLDMKDLEGKSPEELGRMFGEYLEGMGDTGKQ